VDTRQGRARLTRVPFGNTRVAGVVRPVLAGAHRNRAAALGKDLHRSPRVSPRDSTHGGDDCRGPQDHRSGAERTAGRNPVRHRRPGGRAGPGLLRHAAQSPGEWRF